MPSAASDGRFLACAGGRVLHRSILRTPCSVRSTLFPILIVSPVLPAGIPTLISSPPSTDAGMNCPESHGPAREKSSSFIHSCSNEFCQSLPRAYVDHSPYVCAALLLCLSATQETPHCAPCEHPQGHRGEATEGLGRCRASKQSLSASGTSRDPAPASIPSHPACVLCPVSCVLLSVLFCSVPG